VGGTTHTRMWIRSVHRSRRRFSLARRPFLWRLSFFPSRDKKRENKKEFLVVEDEGLRRRKRTTRSLSLSSSPFLSYHSQFRLRGTGGGERMPRKCNGGKNEGFLFLVSLFCDTGLDGIHRGDSGWHVFAARRRTSPRDVKSSRRASKGTLAVPFAEDGAFPVAFPRNCASRRRVVARKWESHAAASRLD